MKDGSDAVVAGRKVLTVSAPIIQKISTYVHKTHSGMVPYNEITDMRYHLIRDIMLRLTHQGV